MTPSKENKCNGEYEVHDNFRYFVIITHETTADETYGPYSKKDAIEVAKGHIGDGRTKVYICEAIAKVTCAPKIEKI